MLWDRSLKVQHGPSSPVATAAVVQRVIVFTVARAPDRFEAPLVASQNIQRFVAGWFHFICRVMLSFHIL